MLTELSVLVSDYQKYCAKKNLDDRSQGWVVNYHDMVTEGDPNAEMMLRMGINFLYKEAIQYVNWIGTQAQRINDFEKSVIGNLTTSDQYENKGWLFITIGFDDKVINPSKMVWAIEKIKKIKKMNYTFFRYVHEKFRKDKDGQIYEHHHTHILVRTDKYKSDFIDQAFRFLSPIINGQKNYIDVKTPKDKCGTFSQKLKYIEGDKQTAKLECCDLDKVWRNKNGLEEILFSPT